MKMPEMITFHEKHFQTTTLQYQGFPNVWVYCHLFFTDKLSQFAQSAILFLQLILPLALKNMCIGSMVKLVTFQVVRLVDFMGRNNFLPLDLSLVIKDFCILL